MIGNRCIVRDTAVFLPLGEEEEAILAYFPLYLELSAVPCLVVGGGSIALHKVRILREFGADVTVTAPEICQELRRMNGVHCISREFIREDIEEMSLVVAATGDPVINRRISGLCRQRGIPVNVVDQPEDCDFIFPSYIKRGEVVASFSSGGQSPVVAQYLKQQNEPIVTERLGEISACLGSLRSGIKRRIPVTGQRREIYEKILQLSLEADQIPEAGQLEDIIKEAEQDGSYETIEDE